MRRDKPSPTPDPPSPRRQTFPGLSDALDRLAEVAGYYPEFDELCARLDELAAFAPIVRWHARHRVIALSSEAVKLLGRQVRPVRDSLGLARAQLAAMCGLAEGTIRNFETGRHRITDGRVAMILGTLLPLVEADGKADPELIAALRAGHRAAVAASSPEPQTEEPEAMSKDDSQETTQPPSPDPPNEPWGRSVQRRREAFQMKQEELAVRAGLSLSDLKGIESGHVEPTKKQRREIEAVLREAAQLERIGKLQRL
ncbi:MAG: hypothetical protein JNJ46_22930 [Myxococcales bacterium]|nr:hypothetical protein [Myxococcales bacterium]